jgi:hypothetical protein
MDMLIVFLAPFALGFGAGYGVREWKSRMRRRRYSGGWQNSREPVFSQQRHSLARVTAPIIRFLQCPIYPTNGPATGRQGNRRPNGADARAAGNPGADCDPVRPSADTGARSHVRAAASPP